MWIHIFSNSNTNFNSKSGRKRSFSYENNASIHLSQKREWICGFQPLKEKWLLCESMFIPVERQTLIPKLVERKVFLIEWRHQYHLSKWEEGVYGS